MKADTKQKRFTLSVPANVHEELTKMANERGITARDVVLKSLKLGLLAMSIENDSDKELILRENTKETRLLLV
jgi:hypothetical protein